MSERSQGKKRRQAVGELKRGLILDAAREVFAREGLEGASLRAIAAEAGYTAAALYFHFDSKEAIYAALLEQSLERLRQAVDAATGGAEAPADRLRRAAKAFFRFYAAAPQDLDLGFYLFRGGVKPKGVGAERDKALNASLAAALAPIAAAAEALGMPEREARALAADVFAHIVGLLLLQFTGRIRMFGADSEALLEDYLERLLGGM